MPGDTNRENLLTTSGRWGLPNGCVPRMMSMWEKKWIPGGADLEPCFNTWEQWRSPNGLVPRKMSMGEKSECSIRLTLNVAWLGNSETLRMTWSNLLISTWCDDYPFEVHGSDFVPSIFCRRKSFYITSTITSLFVSVLIWSIPSVMSAGVLAMLFFSGRDETATKKSDAYYDHRVANRHRQHSARGKRE